MTANIWWGVPCICRPKCRLNKKRDPDRVPRWRMLVAVAVWIIQSGLTTGGRQARSLLFNCYNNYQCWIIISATKTSREAEKKEALHLSLSLTSGPELTISTMSVFAIRQTRAHSTNSIRTQMNRWADEQMNRWKQQQHRATSGSNNKQSEGTQGTFAFFPEVGALSRRTQYADHGQVHSGESGANYHRRQHKAARDVGVGIGVGVGAAYTPAAAAYASTIAFPAPFNYATHLHTCAAAQPEICTWHAPPESSRAAPGTVGRAALLPGRGAMRDRLLAWDLGADGCAALSQ